MTYNVHRCVGWDRVHSPRRIAQTIARYEPDIVALQELDVGRFRTGRCNQPGILAEQLQMHYFFFPAYQASDEHYGDAILSRFPMRLVQAGSLPTLEKGRHLERRGALWAAIECQGRTLQLVNTHLGLNGEERLRQVEALLGPNWCAHAACERPRILCGDFNAWPGTRAYGRLRARLRDAQLHRGAGKPRNTFPSRCPILRIDHIFHDPEIRVLSVQVPRTRWTALVSDHLPVIAEVALS